jgi:hypothetical protein
MGKLMEKCGTYKFYNVIVMYGQPRDVLKGEMENIQRQKGIQRKKGEN